jgi:hypothetical protein
MRAVRIATCTSGLPVSLAERALAFTTSALLRVVMVFSKKFDMRQQPEMPDGVNLLPLKA